MYLLHLAYIFTNSGIIFSFLVTDEHNYKFRISENLYVSMNLFLFVYYYSNSFSKLEKYIFMHKYRCVSLSRYF